MTTTNNRLVMNGIAYVLEPCEKDILILVEDEQLNETFFFNKILKNGFRHLCEIIENEEISGWFGKAEEAKLRAKEQLVWYVEQNWMDVKDLED